MSKDLAKRLLKIAEELTADGGKFLDLMLDRGDGLEEAIKVAKFAGLHGGYYMDESGTVNLVICKSGCSKDDILAELFMEDQEDLFQYAEFF